MINRFENCINFMYIEYQLQENIFPYFFTITFYKASSNSERSSTNLKSFTSNFYDIAQL